VIFFFCHWQRDQQVNEDICPEKPSKAISLPWEDHWICAPLGLALTLLINIRQGWISFSGANAFKYFEGTFISDKENSFMAFSAGLSCDVSKFFETSLIFVRQAKRLKHRKVLHSGRLLPNSQTLDLIQTAYLTTPSATKKKKKVFPTSIQELRLHPKSISRIRVSDDRRRSGDG